jgi:hypothetical protein
MDKSVKKSYSLMDERVKKEWDEGVKKELLTHG